MCEACVEFFSAAETIWTLVPRRVIISGTFRSQTELGALAPRPNNPDFPGMISGEVGA